ncbi:hypothetical protein R1flu_013298 [Riccia fluitans]|uniref:Condensin complex subunit 1 C-terminal domain-containing protein n=1 Tax=Riccia fluitans TaxID=41844 RepID=A0ABD1YGJ1_9MARC
MEAMKHLSSLLQTAAAEFELSGGTVGENGVQGCCLSAETLADLHDFFLSSGSRASELEGLWEDLAERQVPLCSVAEILSGTMLKGGVAGIKAVEVYLSLLTTPDCPVFSLYSQMAFDALARCLRNCCKPGSSSGTAEVNPQEGDRRKAGQRKGKRVRGRSTLNEGIDDNELNQSQQSSQSQLAEKLTVQEVSSVLLQLQKSLHVLHLKERQETLKLVVELLVTVLHLASDMSDEENGRNENGGRQKKRAPLPSLQTSTSDIIFHTLDLLFDPKHGEPLKNAIIILREITPTILLTRSGATARVDIRNSALQFVTRTLLKNRESSVQQAMVALPRFICCKAPEKTDGRALAIDSVMMLLKPLDIHSLNRFADFVSKFSHSKPRHRLIAVDVALALLGGFPDALKCRTPHASPGPSTAEPSPYERGRRSYFTSERRRTSRFRDEGNAGQCSSAGNAGDGKNDAAEEERVDMDVQEEEESTSLESQWWGVTCTEVLLHRSSDKVPSIRSRALANLGQAIELLSVDVMSRRVLQTLLGFNGSAPPGPRTSNANPAVPQSRDTGDTPILGGYTPTPEPCSDQPGATPLTPGAGHRDLWSLLQRRCVDDKVAVRKSALLLMKKSITLLGKAPENEILHSMGVACSDAMISIRKSALAALSEVLRKFPGDIRVIREWLRSALPLAFDNETSLQDECLDLFEQLVVDRISLISTLKLPRGNQRNSSANGISQTARDTQHHNDDVEKLVPVGALALLTEVSDGGSIASCVKRICISLGKKKRIRPGLALALQNLIAAHSSPDGAWFFLSEVSSFTPKAVGWEFLRTHWQLLDDSSSSSQESSQGTEHSGNGSARENSKWAENRVHLLQTISNVAIELPPDAADNLATELFGRLRAFDMHPAEVGAHIKALAVLCKRKAAAPGQGDQLVEEWVKQLVKESGDILQGCITPPAPANMEQEQGDVFRTPTTQAHRDKQDGTFLDHREVGSRVELSSKVVTVIFTIGALALVCPQVKDDRVVTLLQTLITTAKRLIGRSRGCEAQRLLIKEVVTPEVYVHLWVALGKLCLADDALAKRCIPLFVQELGRTNSAAVRNNIMIIMADFCVRYTALVDGYLHELTKTLKDSCELVRRQTFVLLARLLQRDYVKWRGTLFHRFLLMLVDDSAKISELAKFVISSILKLKAPLLAYNSFVEVVFVLNDCTSQASSSAVLQVPESERALFSLRGNTEDVLEKRMQIYKLLLQQMNPEHLLAISAKLCAEILAAAADGLLDLNDGASQCVLQDALLILASKELRVINARGSAGTADLEEEEGSAAAAVAAVKGRVVTQLMKKNLVQNAVPIFIELKRLLESKNSPLLGLLMDSMRQMLKDYKNEIEEILVGDKQLQKEILYDMQKHEAAKARARVAAVMPGNNASVQGGSPGKVRTPVATSVRSTTAEQMGKSAQGRREKENIGGNVQSGSGLLRSKEKNLGHADVPPRSPMVTTMRKSGLGSLLSPRADNRTGSTPQVTWQDRTPTMNGRTHSAIRSSVSRLQTCASIQARPQHPHTSRPPDPLSPLRPSQEDTCLAGAVADVAAAATVATVLQQVAQKSVTPLRGMSLPRLRPSVATGRRNATPPNFQVSLGQQTPSQLRQSLAGGENGLETVRRRQSFSSVEDIYLRLMGDELAPQVLPTSRRAFGGGNYRCTAANDFESYVCVVKGIRPGGGRSDVTRN